MFEAIDFNFQTYLYRRRYFRLHTEQHSIIVSFLLSYPVWQPIKNFAQSIHNRLDRSRSNLNQINVFAVTWLRREIEFMQSCSSSECQLRSKELIAKDGNQGTTDNQVLLNLCIIYPRSMLTPLLYCCSVYHISSVSISTLMFIFHRLSLDDGLSSADVLKG